MKAHEKIETARVQLENLDRLWHLVDDDEDPTVGPITPGIARRHNLLGFYGFCVEHPIHGSLHRQSLDVYRGVGYVAARLARELKPARKRHWWHRRNRTRGERLLEECFGLTVEDQISLDNAGVDAIRAVRRMGKDGRGLTTGESPWLVARMMWKEGAKDIIRDRMASLAALYSIGFDAKAETDAANRQPGVANIHLSLYRSRIQRSEPDLHSEAHAEPPCGNNPVSTMAGDNA